MATKGFWLAVIMLVKLGAEIALALVEGKDPNDQGGSRGTGLTSA